MCTTILPPGINIHITFEVDGDGNITGLEADARGQLRHFNKK
jgi:hypothetical protein